MTLSHDRYTAEIVAQTGLLRAAVDGGDLGVPVPSCPGWSVARLARHLGGVQRWAAGVIRARATGPVPGPDTSTRVEGLPPGSGDDPAVVGPWLSEGAASLAAALADAGPGTALWTPVPDGTIGFYARRFTHETAVHRADATLALGAAFTLDPEVAADAIDEWMELGALPFHFEVHPRMRELLGPGRTIHLHATDTPPEAAAEWVVDLTGDAIAWRRAHEKSAVAVRGPLTDLLLLVYRRRPVRTGNVEVLGDADLLDFWLDRVEFG
jgi:uncharacterized protein (TIGR03083 family)